MTPTDPRLIADTEADEAGIMRERLVAVVEAPIDAWWGSLDPRPTLPEVIVQAIEAKGFVVTP